MIEFSPELFLTYAFNLDVYHPEQIDTNEFRIIKDVVSSPVPKEQNLSILPEPRRRAIHQFGIAVRNAKFRKYILQAYKNTCAICGMQLNLVEAAHIVPVKEEGTDEITNGIAWKNTRLSLIRTR